MRDKDRHAIGDADGQCCAALTCDVSVRLARTKPSLPTASVHQNPIAMNLSYRHEPGCYTRQLVLDRGPTAHDFVDRVGAGQAERSGVARRREGTNAPTLEVGDYLLRNAGQVSDAGRQRE